MWSYILESLGLISAVLLSRKLKAGWFVSIIDNIGWGIYAYKTNQGGIVMGAVIALGVAFYALWYRAKDL